MKLIIDIDEETLKEVNRCGLFLNPRDKENLVNSIKHGTPLPKGHGRLIDADGIISEATKSMKYPSNHEYMECVIAHMKLAPTIIEADTESEDKK